MKRVYVNDFLSRVQLVRLALAMEGIPVFIKNETAAVSLWDVVAYWPEVWIYQDSDYDRAREVVQDVVGVFLTTPRPRGYLGRWLIVAFILFGGPVVPISAVLALGGVAFPWPGVGVGFAILAVLILWIGGRLRSAD